MKSKNIDRPNGRIKTVQKFDPLVGFGHIQLSGAELKCFQSWEIGFDGFFNGLRRDALKQTKHTLSGWDAAQVVDKMNKEREEGCV